jgi:hypothetical protein
MIVLVVVRHSASIVAILGRMRRAKVTGYATSVMKRSRHWLKASARIVGMTGRRIVPISPISKKYVMSLEHMLRDEREAWRFLLGEAARQGEFAMFVKIGERAINLDNVTQVVSGEYDGRACIRVDFIGGECYRFYSSDPGYRELQTWMSEQPTLLHD